MRKLFIIALFVLGIYNAPMFGMAQEIILSELCSMTPFDDPKDSGREGGTDPTQIYASINGDQLNIDTGMDAPVYAEVIDPETGEIVAEEEFEGETTMFIPKEGDYEVYIYTESGTVLTGEFEME